MNQLPEYLQNLIYEYQGYWINHLRENVLVEIRKNSFYYYLQKNKNKNKRKRNRSGQFLNFFPEENIELFQRHFPNSMFIYEKNEAIVLMETQQECLEVLRSNYLSICNMNGWIINCF